MAGEEEVYRLLRLSDPERLVEGIRGSDMVPCQLSGRPMPSELLRIGLPAGCLDIANLGPAMLFTGQMPRGCYTLVFVVSCPATGRAFNFGTDHVDGYLGFFPPGGGIDAFTPEGYGNATLTVPQDHFLAAAEHWCPELSDAFLEKGGALKLPPELQTGIRRVVSDLRALDKEGVDGLGHEEVRLALQEELLRTFLGALQHAQDFPVTSTPFRRARRLRRFRDLRDHLSGNPSPTVGLDYLCQVSGLSARGVEYLFRDYLGVGPTTYLRYRRLHAARHRLLEAARDPVALPSVSVKSVALDLGFWHFGRFSRYYREFFGESPHETLAGP